MGSIFRHPEPGDVVGDYRLVEQLGDGSFGLVFKAERAGRCFAMKFLHDATWGVRARREVAILAEMDHPCVVRFHGFDRWPVPMIGTPYIVMDLVEGLTLEAHAAAHNPSARKAARLIFQAGLTLGEIHQRGVFHRDLKPANIVIAGKSEVPVLIDFGVGWHVGAPGATEEGTLPGTLEFQTPEAIQRAGRHECRPSDELWALGVCFYWLLTDILPFGDRLDDGFLERVLHLKPLPPHVLNPRVPEMLSAVCVKMLEKDSGARYATVVEFCAALDKALSEADSVASWDVPLFDPASASDEEFLAGVKEPDSMRWIRRWIRESPRRGGKLAQEQDGGAAVAQGEGDQRHEVQKDAARESSAVTVAALAAPVIPTPAGPPVVAAPYAPSPGLQRWTLARRQGPLWMQGFFVSNLPRPALALIAGVVVVSLAVYAVGLSQQPTPAPRGSATFMLTGTEVPLSVASPGENATEQTGHIREVAQSGNPTEAGRNAAPIGPSTPAPKATAMLRKQKSRSKAEDKPTIQAQPVALDCIPVFKWLCTATSACALSLTGCSGADVRPTPALAECPAGWKETHAKFGIYGRQIVRLQGHTGILGEAPATVKEGPFVVEVDLRWEKMPPGTLLTGTLTFGENRFFGRFTQAHTPDRQTQPVCIEVYQSAPRSDGCAVGVGSCPRLGSKPGTFKVSTGLEVRPTSRFK